MDVPCSIQGNIHAFSLIINVSRNLGTYHPRLLFFLFSLKVSLSPAGPPPEIVQSIHARKKYKKQTQKHCGAVIINSIQLGFYIDDFEETCGFYNRSNGGLHRM